MQKQGEECSGAVLFRLSWLIRLVFLLLYPGKRQNEIEVIALTRRAIYAGSPEIISDRPETLNACVRAWRSEIPVDRQNQGTPD